MFQAVASYEKTWQDCLSTIKSQTTQEEFVKWFESIVPLEHSGNILRLGVTNRAHAKEIEDKYISFLRPIVQHYFGNSTSIFYAVPRIQNSTVVASTESNATTPQGFSAQTSTANIKNPFVIPGLKRMNIDPNLNSGYTFANFVEGECNRLSRSAGMAVAVNPGNMNNNPFNPLYIYGDSGLGKTHIVQAIGHEIIQRHPEKQVLYVSMNKFQAQFQTAYKNGEIPDFIHFYQTIDVLIIDDIQELTGKTGTQNAFFNIFNHLHLTGKQIILTSDKSPAELKDIEQRLLTRFKWGFATPVNLPDYETKVKILQSKAKKLKAELSPEVVDYLANNIKANVREIEGALSSLIANASFLQRKVDIALAREVLKIYIKMSHKEITVEGILDEVCVNMSIPKERVLSQERKREVVQARQVAMYLAKQHTQAPLASIGLAIGGRNHATVLHACKAVANMMEMDKNFRHIVEDIEKIVMN
ncbi:MAG: chromosomal replication initiator protein DnaA [Rikenellaceae bacterium]